MKIGANILRMRKNKNLSQSALGALIGVTGSQIGYYERGENEVPQGELVKLAGIFGVTEAELRGLSGEQNRPLVENSTSLVEAMKMIIQDKERIIKMLEAQVVRLECPKASLIYIRLAPLRSNCVAAVCRAV